MNSSNDDPSPTTSPASSYLLDVRDRRQMKERTRTSTGT
uniref:Uncharacterized protein n=1 Tax=Arundo donax TaxID=35708 RepID=A0A0A9HUF1_ARUDO